MTSNSRYLSVSSGHIDSLIAYVLDVKPYHTKLSEVVEEYLFEDTVHVKITDAQSTLAVLGADYQNKSGNPNLQVWANSPIRPVSSLSADRVIQSDGSTRQFTIPRLAVPKLFSSSSQEKFTEADSVTSITGLNSGVFSPRRWEGPGIPSVKRNSTVLAEGVDYHISLGAFSFIVRDSQQWKEANIAHLGAFAKNPGVLEYANVEEIYGSIVDISADLNSPVYEEYSLEWDEGLQKLHVAGSNSGFIGDADFGVPFTSAPINFTFIGTEFSPNAMPSISDGDTFLLTPFNKLTIHPSATEDETWTLIKTNPQSLANSPEFKRNGLIDTSVAMSIFTETTDHAPASSWTIEFTSPTDFTISAEDSAFANLPGYPKVASINNGLAYADGLISFVFSSGIFVAGDTFTFDILEKKATYLVYGSDSGWHPSATVGEWYFNGQIGFKVPPLEYFAFEDGKKSDHFAAIRRPNSVSTPCKYLITFEKHVPYASSPLASATVLHNGDGFKDGLLIGQPWADRNCSWSIVDHAVTVGKKIEVFLASKSSFIASGGYDEFDYDSNGYSENVGKIEYPRGLLEEHFPLYHSHGCVIIPSSIAVDDVVTIDKAEMDNIRLRIETTSDISELSPIDNWIPLSFKSRHADLTSADFPSSAVRLDAQLASNPGLKAFTVVQPASGNCYIEFDSAFFAQYLPEQQDFTLRFNQSSSYNQTIRVKIAENLRIYARVRFEFADNAEILVLDATPQNWVIATALDFTDSFDASIEEGGAFPFVGYDLLPYDTSPLDLALIGYPLFGLLEIPPGSGNFIYTGNPGDSVTLGSVVDDPAPRITDEASETAGTAFTEGLLIVENDTFGSVLSTSVIYDVALNSGSGLLVSQISPKYVVTHNFVGSTPNVVIAPTNGDPAFSVTPDTTPYEHVPSATSNWSFSFDILPGTGPFRLTLT